MAPLTDGFDPPRGRGDGNLKQDRIATAGWADAKWIADNLGWPDPRSRTDKRIFLGGVRLGGKLTYVGVPIGDRHGMTIAGSRAGKGTSFIIPNLLLYPGSVFAFDPKGELAAETAGAREAMGQEVHVFDPFATSGREAARYNPLDMIDPDSETAMDDAGLLADALIQQEGGENRHFSEAARNLLHGAIHALTQVFEHPDEEGANGALRNKGETPVRFADSEGRRNLPHLRALLCEDHDRMMRAAGDPLPDGTNADHDGLLALMWRAGGFAEQAADAFAGKEDREGGAVLSTAQEQTTFLASPPVTRALATSDFRLDKLKTGAISVYMCLPAARLATHARLLRLMLTAAVTRMEHVVLSDNRGKPRDPQVTATGYHALFMLDEFPVLGYLAVIERAAGLMAGYGVKLWIVLQDLTQLKRHYSQGWETFIGNTGLLQAFGNSESTTLEYLKNQLGETLTLSWSFSDSGIGDLEDEKQGHSPSYTTAPLMRPDEIARFFSRNSGFQMVLIDGAPPMALKRVAWFEEGHEAIFGTKRR
jgi:type IV secretion system protein VirD4